MAQAVIALGSNIPSRKRHLETAVQHLKALEGAEVMDRSRIYETPAVGGPPQGPFLNAALSIQATLEPLALLSVLLLIEKKMGRTRTERNGPRIIDLDIIFYENRLLSDPRLELPHPRFRERGFVLWPLQDIIPHFVDPVTGRSVSALLEDWMASGGEVFPISGRL